MGQVELRAHDKGRAIAIEIQTRERAAGVWFSLLERVGLIRRMQAYTWAEMIQKAGQLAGGRPPAEIAVQFWRD